MTGQSHEVFTSFRAVSASSNRKFGLVIGAMLGLIAVVPPLLHHTPVHLWLLVVGAVVFLLGLAAPASLGPANRLWFRFGLLLGRITNPIIMGILFFVVLVPIGWLMRKRGHDLLSLERDDSLATYWIERDATAPMALKNQF